MAIRNVKDHTAVRIPKEQIDGPWLFVDLPSGIYDITATNGAQKRSATGVKIIAGKQKTLYLRWTEDAGASLKLSTE